MLVMISVPTECIYSGMYFNVVNRLDYIYVSGERTVSPLSPHNTVINMQIPKGQLLGGKAFYFDFKWTSYAIMKMQITSELQMEYSVPCSCGSEAHV